MGVLGLSLHRSKTQQDYSEKVFVYGPNREVIGYIQRNILKPNRCCFNFKSKYTIVRESLLHPEEVENNERILMESD